MPPSERPQERYIEKKEDDTVERTSSGLYEARFPQSRKQTLDARSFWHPLCMSLSRSAHATVGNRENGVKRRWRNHNRSNAAKGGGGYSHRID